MGGRGRARRRVPAPCGMRLEWLEPRALRSAAGVPARGREARFACAREIDQRGPAARGPPRVDDAAARRGGRKDRDRRNARRRVRGAAPRGAGLVPRLPAWRTAVVRLVHDARWQQPARRGRDALPLDVGGRILARTSARTARLVVTRADGRRIPVPLRHGVALARIGATASAGDRPVSVEALDREGHVLARRSLGWTAARWRTARPRPFVPQTRAQLRAEAKHPHVPCVGAARRPAATASGEVTLIATDHPVALVADILPKFLGPNGGELYIEATRALQVTLVDGDGTRRPIPLGAGRCAYVTLSPGVRRAPFRLEARAPAGRLRVSRPGDWSGFPTDGA
jgi:hypothetical protein